MAPSSVGGGKRDGRGVEPLGTTNDAYSVFAFCGRQMACRVFIPLYFFYSLGTTIVSDLHFPFMVLFFAFLWLSFGYMFFRS